MPDFAEFFEQALAEEGVDAKVLRDEDPTSDQYHVVKSLGCEKLTYTTAINTRINVTPDEVRTQIATEARIVAREFEEYLTDSFSWAERRISLSPYEGGWARCETCDTKVSVPDANVGPFTMDAELSTPNPIPRDRTRTLSNLDDHARLLLKMYLTGRLRERCESWCHNSKFNDLTRAESDMYRH